MFGKGHTEKESVTKQLNLKAYQKTVPKYPLFFSYM